MFDQIQRIGRYTVEQGRFYCAELVLVIEHLHSKGVVHRDLKPEVLTLYTTS